MSEKFQAKPASKYYQDALNHYVAMKERERLKKTSEDKDVDKS